jgi:tRNA threonylcarbamoyladenosine biosynthesis protein TsaB
MKVLAVDTSGKVLSIAVCDENSVIAEYTINYKMTHSEQLLPCIDQILKQTSIDIQSIDLFAVAEGPGSFTGIRIGVSTIKGFAYSLQKPIVSINALEALCYNINPYKMNVCAILDARNNQVFCGIFKPNEMKYDKVIDYSAVTITELVKTIKDMNVITAFVGDGSIIHRDCIKDQLSGLAYFPYNTNSYQRASNIAILALNEYKEGRCSDSISLVPFYLRKSQAEQQLEKRK